MTIWACGSAPFVMATINTRNVHRSNLLMGFPYGKEFVYDEMMLAGPGEKGEAMAKAIVGANASMGGPGGPKPGEGPSKEERETGNVRHPVCGSRARRQANPRFGQGRSRSRLRSTSKMIGESAVLSGARGEGCRRRHLDAGRSARRPA